MKQHTFHIGEASELEEVIEQILAHGIVSDSKHTLFIVAVKSSSKSGIESCLATLTCSFPGYQFVGCTMLGPNILGAEATGLKIAKGLDLSVLTFETSSFTVLSYDCSILTSVQAGVRFNEDLATISNARGVFLVSSGIDVNADEFLAQTSPEYNHIPVFGTLAGMWESNDFENIFAITGDRLFSAGFVAVAFNGEDLHMHVNSSFGWKPVGKTFYVTAGTDDGFVSAIDGRRPLDLYTRYLRMDPSNPDYADCCTFPLVLSAGEKLNARIPVADERGGFYYGAENPVGRKVSLAYARKEDLLAQSLALANEFAEFQAQGLIGIFCQNRRIFLGSELADREIGYFRHVAPTLCSVSGFGEIMRVNGQGVVCNSTSVVAGFREGPAQDSHTVIEDPGLETLSSSSDTARLDRMLVSLLAQSTVELQHESGTDSLTLIPNRRAVTRWVSQNLHELPIGQTMTLMMFDIDGFKSINDVHGHAVGDKVLIAIAASLKDHASEETIFGRMGGDEFFGASVSLTQPQAKELLKKVCEHLAENELLSSLDVTLSGGISTLDRTAKIDESGGYFTNADRALYHSKQHGGNQVTIYEEAYQADFGKALPQVAITREMRRTFEISDFPIVVYRMFEGKRKLAAVSNGFCELLGIGRKEASRYLESKTLSRVLPADNARVHDFLSHMETHPSGLVVHHLRTERGYHKVMVLGRSTQVDETRIIVLHYTDLEVERIDHVLDQCDLVREDRSRLQQPAGAPVPPLLGFPPAARQELEKLPIALSVLVQDGDSYCAVLVSDGACRLFSLEREDLIRYLSNRSYKKVHPEDSARLMDAATRIGESSQQTVVARLEVDGAYQPVLFRQYRQFMPDGTPCFFVTYTNLSEAAGNATKIYSSYFQKQDQTSLLDSVTGLPDVSYLYLFAPGHLRDAFDNGNKPRVLFFNIRGMRAYNQRYGYHRGDELLKHVGQTIQSHFGDSLVARYTDDHFVAVTTCEDLGKRIQKVKEALDFFTKNGSESINVGVHTYTAPAEPLSSAIDKARLAADYIQDDRSLSESQYDSQIESYYNQRDYVLSNWRKALAEGNITVFLQPILGMFNDKITSMEALVRWNDPEQGFIPPSTFIPVLEDHHLSYQLDLEVLRMVCRTLGQRKRRNLPFVPVSINLSRSDLNEKGLVESIEKTINEYGLEPQDISIEITETALLNNEALIQECIDRFHEHGHRVYLDDFGSGYSSFNTLQNFDFDILKIDMMFLRHANEKSPVILTDIIDMSKRLSMTPLMEGVETNDELEMLKGAGCSLGQGYFIAKPMPDEDVFTRVDEGTLSLVTPEEREFYGTIARVNVLDASNLGNDHDLSPICDRNVVAVICVRGDDFSVVYQNSATTHLQQMLMERRGEKDAKLELGPTLRKALFRSLEQVLETGEDTFENVDTPELKANLRFRMIARTKNDIAYLVVGYNAYVPGAEGQDPITEQFWTNAARQGGERVSRQQR